MAEVDNAPEKKVGSKDGDGEANRRRRVGKEEREKKRKKVKWKRLGKGKTGDMNVMERSHRTRPKNR